MAELRSQVLRWLREQRAQSEGLLWEDLVARFGAGPELDEAMSSLESEGAIDLLDPSGLGRRVLITRAGMERLESAEPRG